MAGNHPKLFLTFVSQAQNNFENLENIDDDLL